MGLIAPNHFIQKDSANTRSNDEQLHLPSSQSSISNTNIIPICNDYDENTSKNKENIPISSPLSCIRDSNENFMHFVEENVSNISIDDSIERTDHNNTEYIFDNSSRSLNNELLEKDYNECQDDNNKVLHSTFTDSIERTYNNTEYIIDNPTKSLNNELLEKDYNNCQDNN
ncbi:MATH and LRR domain-containing protein PFE0570w-like, partial [Nylanderia fulva]|uniref:MATH and LRR domain-containing protein PFE0570w-like n=1 Tax=Nylanderia fulva TaxID=613905 RepID=UPI0010FB19EF